ncbi:low-affinity cAMP phosphodiesterase [Thiovulum sp. ES]|nr:low-affinity cAMP phosphodiesterase [Thiovulum sp. ES]
MNYLGKVLGASGSKTRESGTVSFQIADNILIDAGNIFQKYEFDTNKIEHVFISHSHFDHILELPFLIENGFTVRTKPLKIHGLKSTIDNIKKFMFNNDIWPDFSLIPLLTTGEKSISFEEFEFNQVIELEGMKITPIEMNHIVPTAGFIVEKENDAFALSSDTYITDKFWQIINKNKKVSKVLIEVSFESVLDGLAKVSKHLTPHLLDEELNKLSRDDLDIFIYHIKEASYNQVQKELKEFPNLIKYNVRDIPSSF